MVAIQNKQLFYKVTSISFITITALSVIGFGTFGRHPELLAQFPWATEIYGKAHSMFAQGHTIIAFLTAVALLFRYVEFKWLKAFAATYLISFMAEFGGTSIGIPFGHYQYSSLLGPKIFDHVPFIIPTSWFTMAIMAYGTAYYFFRDHRGLRVLFGAMMITAWDFALDPAMSYTASYWTWSTPGAFFGMPIFNPIGWMITGATIIFAMDLLKTHQWISKVPLKHQLFVYILNAFLPFAMLLVSGVWEAALISAFVIGGVLFLMKFVSDRRPHSLSFESI